MSVDDPLPLPNKALTKELQDKAKKAWQFFCLVM